MGAPVGNKNSSRGAQLRSKINAAFARRDEMLGLQDGGTLEQILDGFISEALTDKSVRSELFDRLYGKPAQAVTGGDEDDEPIKFERVIRLVKGADAS